VRYLQHRYYSGTIIYIHYNQLFTQYSFGLPIALAHSETAVIAVDSKKVFDKIKPEVA
jgi:hypothetical protein